jgi:hypothetical protein
MVHFPHQTAQNVAASVANDAARGSTTRMSHVGASDRNFSHVTTAHHRLRLLRKKPRIGGPRPSPPPQRRRAAHHRIPARGGDRISGRILRVGGQRETLRCPITHRRRRRSGRSAASSSLPHPRLNGRVVEPRLGGSLTTGDLVSERGDIVAGIAAMGALHLSHLCSLMTIRIGGVDLGKSSLLAGP